MGETMPGTAKLIKMLYKVSSAPTKNISDSVTNKEASMDPMAITAIVKAFCITRLFT